MKEVKWETEALKYMARLDKPTRERIRRAVDEYALIGIGDVKRLQGRHDEYRLRVGSYRVIFINEEEHLVIVVLKVGPRGDIYKS